MVITTRSFAVLSALGIGALLAVYSIGRASCKREASKREVDDLARWEGEGGPPPPEERDPSSYSTA